MTADDVEGCPSPVPVWFNAATFDLEYAAINRSTVLWDIAAGAFGDDYPLEVQPWGATTWSVLGQLVAAAKLQPGQLVVDIGCGRGGPGLWVARATGAQLVGVDWSAVAVEQARTRADHFVPPGRARFVVGDLSDTTLEPAQGDVVMCLDALPYARDRGAALREAHRLLRPGGRYLATLSEADGGRYTPGVSEWSSLCSAAGLVVESIEEIPGYSDHLATMSALWSANQDLLREELGEAIAYQLVERARQAGLGLEGQRQVLLCARAAGVG